MSHSIRKDHIICKRISLLLILTNYLYKFLWLIFNKVLKQRHPALKRCCHRSFHVDFQGKICFIERRKGQVWWLTPVIPALWEVEADRSQGQKLDTSLANMVKHPSLLKYKKLARCHGVHLQSQLCRKLRQGNHLNLGGGDCSEPKSRHCTSIWQHSKTLSQEQQQKEDERVRENNWKISREEKKRE